MCYPVQPESIQVTYDSAPTQALPTFLADEKERATTRYINITTIATFFSSVTATTIQFSLPSSNTPMGSVVNLFWYLSLVFSVSSGISSLLGLTWRKSSMYVRCLSIMREMTYALAPSFKIRFAPAAFSNQAMA